MHDLDVQIRDYIDATSEPLTVNDILYVPIGDEPVRPIAPRQPDRRSRRGWLIAAAAAAVVLVTLGLLPFLLRGRSIEPAATTIPTPAPTSTTIPSTTVVSAAALPVDWYAATGSLPFMQAFGVDSIVSNGSSFLGLTSDGSDSGVLVRSVDGVSWSEIPAPAKIEQYGGAAVAVGGYYVMSEYDSRCQSNCPVWVSRDGLEWEKIDSNLENSWGLHDRAWGLDTLETFLGANPPEFDQLDAFKSVVMEYGDHLAVYGTDHARGHNFAALESTDGVTWTEIEPLPPFAPVLTNEYLGVGWQWMWRCEFAVRDSQGMALVSGDDGQSLWTTQDGLAWSRLPNPPKATDAPDRGRCINAVDDGWIIAPGGVIGLGAGSNDGEFVMGTPGSVLFSDDGIAWVPVEFPKRFEDFDGRIEVAGSTIFIMASAFGETPDILVGELQGGPRP